MELKYTSKENLLRLKENIYTELELRKEQESVGLKKDYDKLIKEIFKLMAEIDQLKNRTSNSSKVLLNEKTGLLDLKQRQARFLDSKV